MNANASTRRRGAALVAALVALAIIVAMLGVMLLAAVQARRQLLRERDLRQCELVLRAGMDRAANRLAGDAGYTGETWTLAADVPAGLAVGRVTIRVSRAAADQEPVLRITAEYPLGDETSIRRSFTGTLQTRTPTEEK